MPLFSGAELLEMIEAATYLAVNDYEGRLLAERTGLALEDIARMVDALVVTMGADGSRIHAGDRVLSIPAVKPAALVDPTGCGDAYRAGLLYGIAHGWDWEKTGRVAALLGAAKIATRGGQNHTVGRDSIAALYYEIFGNHLW
jgi:adenosine kinase